MDGTQRKFQRWDNQPPGLHPDFFITFLKMRRLNYVNLHSIRSRALCLVPVECCYEHDAAYFSAAISATERQAASVLVILG